MIDISLIYRNEKIDFSDDYFSLKNNTISLFFMWILWKKSDCKYLHSLLNGEWECHLFFFMRIWCSNYSNMQYWLSSNHILIIIPSYDDHHVHESQSFKSLIYSLVQERNHFNHTKKNWFPFILMLPDQNKMGLKYQPGCFSALH